jgi:transposase InsO family protein
VRSHQL